MKIIGANVTGSFILNSQDVTTTIQTSNVWSGSVATDITALNASTASLNRATSSLNAATASLNAVTASLLNYTASNNDAIADILLETASFNAFSASILNYTASTNGAISDILLETASINTFTSSIDGRVSTIEGKYITTGSNTFVGVQYVSNTTQATTFTSTASLYTDGGLRIGKDAYVSGSAFIKGNLTVFGTSSIEYVTSSVFVGLEYIDLNTDLPALRYAGIRVYDSGSNVGVTGSLFWDSQTNHWVYSNPSGSSYSGGMLISGPRASTLGSEQGTTNNALMKGQGGDHITSSAILDDGTSLRIPYLTIVTGTVGATTFSGSGANLTSIPNAALTNSTISGIALGSNLATLTIGTGLSGTSYNGSGAVTIANTGVTSNVAGTGITVSGATGAVTITNSGVTSIVAGTGISINQGTGAVTVTNTITNNNQLTNGAGYITSGGTSADSNLLNGISAVNLYNNMGAAHGTRSSFDASSPSYGFGYRFVQGNTNGPGTGGGQFYSWYVGLGSEYPATGAGSYGAMFAVDRNVTGPYLSVRYNESNTFTSWRRMNAGYADSTALTNAPTYNLPAVRVSSSGTSSSGASFAIQQMTTEGWTGIFVDFEPNTGWGLYHDNPNNYLCVTAETATGGLRNFTVPSRESGNRTAYEKIRFNQVDGSILAGGDITAFSDARSKDNIEVITNAVDKVKAIRGVTYTKIDSEGDARNIRHAGVLAQEVLKVLPEVVHTDHNTGMYSVAYGNMAGLLIEAIKEQQTQIEELKSIINGLTK
jgi:hypothetical protein